MAGGRNLFRGRTKHLRTGFPDVLKGEPLEIRWETRWRQGMALAKISQSRYKEDSGPKQTAAASRDSWRKKTEMKKALGPVLERDARRAAVKA